MLLLSVAALRCAGLPACLRQAKNFMWHGAEVKRRKKMCIFIQDFFLQGTSLSNQYTFLRFVCNFVVFLAHLCESSVCRLFLSCHLHILNYFLQKLEMAAKIDQIKLFISTLALKLKSFLDITALGKNCSFWKYYILHYIFHITYVLTTVPAPFLGAQL